MLEEACLSSMEWRCFLPLYETVHVTASVVAFFHADLDADHTPRFLCQSTEEFVNDGSFGIDLDIKFNYRY